MSVTAESPSAWTLVPTVDGNLEIAYIALGAGQSASRTQAGVLTYAMALLGNA